MKNGKIILLLITIFLISISAYSAITADTQMKGTAREVDVTRQLRAAIMADEQLSMDAHNIKIITVKNSILLKGHVASRAEKVKIENLARARAGKMRVYNRLTY
jgi:hyperosmotically inducible protein